MSQTQIAEDYTTKPKYKAYAEEVNTVLLTFDRSKEWADLIKSLQKLGKTLVKHPFPAVPHKIVVGKRLAQCLNPALPSGVHLKSVETYDIIFSKIEGSLASDLSVYCMGLFPFFEYASTQVKPRILELFEKYFIKLDKGLLPCLPGLVVCLLPGLEEETSEFYPRVVKLLDSICEVTDRRLFYRALWRAILVTPAVRLPALNYFLLRMPKQKSEEDIEDLMPERKTLVMSALDRALSDSNILVQRTALEILNVHLPLHLNIFERDDLIKLMKSAILVLVRREMSLNRRIFSWLLDDEDNSDYFSNYKDIAIDAVKEIFAIQPDSEKASVLPPKILMALLDREEVGAAIIDDILLPVFRYLYRLRDGPYAHEVMRSINLLCDLLQPGMLWNWLENLFTQEVARNVDTLESVALLDTIVGTLALKDVEVLNLYVPSLLCAILLGLETILARKNYTQLHSTFQLLLKLIGKLQSTLGPDSPDFSEVTQDLIIKATNSFERFYVALIEEYIFPVCSQGGNLKPGDTLVSIFDLACQLIVTLHTYFPLSKTGEKIVLREVPTWFEAIMKCAQLEDPFIACIAIRAFTDLLTGLNDKSINLSSLVRNRTNYVQLAAKKIWDLLQPSLVVVHYQAAELFLDLSQICDDICSEVIAEAMSDKNIDKRVEGYQRFALLWRLTGELSTAHHQMRPFSSTLFLLLDSLNDDHPMIRLVGRSWLADSITRIDRVLDPLLLVLLDPSTARANSTYQKIYDTRRVLHVWRILKIIIECDLKLFMQHVSEKPVSKDILALNSAQILTSEYISDTETKSIVALGSDFLEFTIQNYLDLLILTALRFIQGKVPESFPSEFIAQNGVVQVSSAEFLQYLLMKIPDKHKGSEVSSVIHESVLQNLAEAVSLKNLVLQVNLLGLVRALVLLDASEEFPLLEGKKSIKNAPMLGQTLSSGLIQSSTKNIRFYWLEFITSCLPYLKANLAQLVTNVCACACNIIADASDNIFDSFSAKDILNLLKSMTLLVNFCTSQVRETRSSSLNAGSSLRLLTDFVKDVFTSEVEQQQSPNSARDALLHEFPSILISLLKTWGTTPTSTKLGGQTLHFTLEGEVHNRYAIQEEIIHILDGFAHTSTVRVLAVIINVVTEMMEPPVGALLEILNRLEDATPDGVLSAAKMLLGTIKGVKPSSAKMRSSSVKIDDASLRPETLVLEFVELYVNKFSKNVDMLVQSWPTLLELIKDSLSWFPSSFLNLLRILDSFVKRTPPLQDRRSKRDLQDTAQKLIELSVNVASKNFSGYPPTSETPGVTPENPSTNTNLDNTPPPEDFVVMPRSEGKRSQVSMKALILLSNILPSMIDMIFDEKGDRVNTMLVNIFHLLIPHIKDKSTLSSPNATTTIALFSSLCDYPFVVKALRKDMIDYFHDNDFFVFLTMETVPKWKKIIDWFMKPIDPKINSFSDLLRSLNKSSTPYTSPALFISKEQDIINRARQLKRVAFVIHSGQVDQYIANFAAIQEKIVETLKTNTSTFISIQLFLLLRVLLTRFSANHLRTLWPIVISEIIRIFTENSEKALILAACKFIDLVVVYRSEDFAVFEWMFLGDVIAAGAQNFVPYVDTIMSSSVEETSSSGKNLLQQALIDIPATTGRRPLITLRTISELRPQDFSGFVEMFINKWKQFAYENLVENQNIDYEYISRLLDADFIEFV